MLDDADVGGFYAELPVAQPQSYNHPQCGVCRLDRQCQSPRMPVDGDGRARIMVIAEGPGADEDGQNRPLVGKTGRLMESTLRECGINMRRDCRLLNAIACRATDKRGRNRPPTEAEISYCRPNVLAAIEKYKPEVIILAGKHAVQSVVGHFWREDVKGIGRWVGFRIPDRRLNSWLCPVWHPSFVSRSKDEDDTDGLPIDELVLRFWREHLQAAVNCQGRPWPDGPPDLDSRAGYFTNDAEAADFLDDVRIRREPFSFDFETDGLKPESNDLGILCCSVCRSGNVSRAFPWTGRAVQAMVELLKTDIPKVGWNLKFELRWCLSKLGVRVGYWVHDGMLAAHVLDNRSGITGLKFNAYAHLGIGPYDAEVVPFLKSDKQGGNARNRIRELPLSKVLKYCALDSLYEWLVGDWQREQLGLPKWK
jgi:DNA polymerase